MNGFVSLCDEAHGLPCVTPLVLLRGARILRPPPLRRKTFSHPHEARPSPRTARFLYRNPCFPSCTARILHCSACYLPATPACLPATCASFIAGRASLIAGAAIKEARPAINHQRPATTQQPLTLTQHRPQKPCQPPQRSISPAFFTTPATFLPISPITFPLRFLSVQLATAQVARAPFQRVATQFGRKYQAPLLREP